LGRGLEVRGNRDTWVWSSVHQITDAHWFPVKVLDLIGISREREMLRLVTRIRKKRRGLLASTTIGVWRVRQEGSTRKKGANEKGDPEKRGPWVSEESAQGQRNF